MTKDDRTFYTWTFIATPFIVSAAFWVSPWLGVPAMFVGAMYLAGILLMFGESAKEEVKQMGKAPEVVVRTTHHFGGTHEERMERIRDAASKAMQRQRNV
jgi:hypothetical protein